MNNPSVRDVALAIKASNGVIEKRIADEVAGVHDRVDAVERRLVEVKVEAKQAAASTMSAVLESRAAGDLLPTYSLGKEYQVGDLVRHNGGVWQAFLDTKKAPGEQESGWVPYINGVTSQRLEVKSLRELSFVTAHSNGEVERTDINLPVPVHTGKWDQSKAYDVGDLVMWDGCSWYCAEKDNMDEPGTSSSWLLAAQRGERGKKGENGLRGEKGDRGERGEQGLAGKDADPLTAAQIVMREMTAALKEKINAK